MTVAEYNAEYARCQRSMIWRLVGSIAVIFASLAIASGVRHFGGEFADVLAPAIVVAVGFPIMLFGFYLADRTYRNFPALICPHCNGNLSRAKSVIVATGNCPSCGRRVLKDDSIGT